MRLVLSALVFAGLFAVAGCQTGGTQYDTSPDMGDTPSGGAVPGQDRY